VQSVLIIRDLVRKLNEQGLTIFVTTHNIEEASQMCDRVAIINHGRVMAIDTPERLKRMVESLQFVEVAFDSTFPGTLESLRALPGVGEVVKEGDKFRLFTNDPPSVLASIWGLAEGKRLRVITLSTLGPSLEDVFVKLTGISPATASAQDLDRVRGRGKREGGDNESRASKPSSEGGQGGLGDHHEGYANLLHSAAVDNVRHPIPVQPLPLLQHR
jgi:ABC-2 type transport system ATP-binding protein